MNNCPKCEAYSILYSELKERVFCINTRCDYSVYLNEKDLEKYKNNGKFDLEDFLKYQRKIM